MGNPSMTSNRSSTTEPDTPSGSVVIKLVLSWALVGVPLAWGVWQVFRKSLDLFR
jgi:hypothetical protein